MQCFTLHSSHEIVFGIPCSKIDLEPDKPAWAVYTGSVAPMGILETTAYPITDRMNVMYEHHIGYSILMDHSCPNSHTLLVKNQSPIGGAWSLELLGNAEIISSGYVPEIRKVAQGPGAEYLLNLPYGSMIKVALCGNTKGSPKYFIICSSAHTLTMRPTSHENFMINGISGTQEHLFKRG